MNMQTRDQRLCVRNRHAGAQFQAPRRFIDRGDHPLIAILIAVISGTSGCGKPPFLRRRRSVAQLGRNSETTRRIAGLHSKGVGFRTPAAQKIEAPLGTSHVKTGHRPGR